MVVVIEPHAPFIREVPSSVFDSPAASRLRSGEHPDARKALGPPAVVELDRIDDEPMPEAAVRAVSSVECPCKSLAQRRPMQRAKKPKKIMKTIELRCLWRIPN
jgi:hypothetical protein